MPTKKKKPTKKERERRRKLGREIAGLFIVTAGIIILFGLGPLGAYGQHALRFMIGSFHPAAALLLTAGAGWWLWRKNMNILSGGQTAGLLLASSGILMAASLPLYSYLSSYTYSSYITYFQQNFTTPEVFTGGILGALLFHTAFTLIAYPGAILTALVFLTAGGILLSKRSFVEAASWAGGKIKPLLLRISQKIKEVSGRYKDRKREIKETEHIEPAEPREAAVDTESEPKESGGEPLIYDFTSRVKDEKPESPAAAGKEAESVESSNDTEEEEPVEASASLTEPETENEDYQLPPVTLLEPPKNQSQQKEHSMLSKNARKLEETLQSFGVSAKVTKVHLGPAVTKYEVYPSTGVKVSRIVNLSDDLALALAARDIRMEAPIPGKSAIGIEVPNQDVSLVTLREVLESPQMKQSANPLSYALGRDISGEAVMAELNKMPHMLVAGATGSGKSVCINGIIISILLRSKPHEVKLMMIDPKMVELNVYNGIPHLLSPVVTEPKKAAQALKRVVSEMERRYELFAATGTRNLEGYNQHVQKENEEAGEQKHNPLPYIVVIVDELADLMMVASGEVEDAITRLAQMARAAGIHLIIATQRPSVDVITGVIKANIPSRIAFGVSSSTDSRTILDSSGAEKLLGKGDMLFIPVGANKATRIQGAFLGDSEVEKVVRHCIEQQQAQYVEEMIPTEQPEQASGEAEDELYDDAVQMVVQMQTASVSMIQRRFRVGYARAARLIDEMEVRGVVGPYEGSKPREVLVEKDPPQE
ncbi:DNA translocase FtsK [Alkalicoccus urumqiensis]|uniref:Cell division protein FtsK n=1 Tax=Alkalicoccus urumqiensis TaxID=1548213 RepID=A0A2P6MFX2_ALKUR|nr:DNA translocase FtsK [Alkalicoccus urumqiensis]PRO65178.1 cell division protein FtsK [Alkalicoccus urumqiensis]